MDSHVISTEGKRRGQIDERVFCANRWEFSKSLPDIITNLHSKPCLPGKGKELFYRQEGAPIQNRDHGWYICTRFGASNKHENLTMSVRSAHWRTNRPIDVIRGSSKRFYALLSQFYAEEKDKREWL